MYSVTPEAMAAQSEEDRRLLVILEACRVKELAAADRLANPRAKSLLASEYMHLADVLRAVQLKCNGARVALMAYRKKMRNGAEWPSD